MYHSLKYRGNVMLPAKQEKFGDIFKDLVTNLIHNVLLPMSQPSEDARLARRQHYRAVRKYCVGGKNLECSRGMFVR